MSATKIYPPASVQGMSREDQIKWKNEQKQLIGTNKTNNDAAQSEYRAKLAQQQTMNQAKEANNAVQTQLNIEKQVSAEKDKLRADEQENAVLWFAAVGLVAVTLGYYTYDKLNKRD